uniref:Z5 n=1 Tax=Schizophyllum commune TaxID=5334 RepID=Q02530_SCHCO|nr:Z5 [Schizophyllum commune]
MHEITECHLVKRLSSAQDDFLAALDKDTDAVANFLTQWRTLSQSLESNTTLQASTLALSHSVSAAIAQVADMLVTQTSEMQTIEDQFRDKLTASIAHSNASTSSLPLPPYIAPCYEWLMDNLHNPYPSPPVKRRLLEAALRDAREGNGHHPTPPPSPTSSHIPRAPSKAPLTIDDINDWFVAVRARMGWGDLRRVKFDGSRSLMLHAARLMWCPDAEELKQEIPSDYARKPTLPKKEELSPRLSLHEFIAFTADVHSSDNESSDEQNDLSINSHAPSVLTPDIEFAFVQLEEQAKSLYAHVFQPSELAGTLSESTFTRPDTDDWASPDVKAYREALALAAADKRRQSRRDQRRAKRARDEARRRETERHHYPSPEPSSDDESSSDYASCSSDADSAAGSDDSDFEEDLSQDDHPFAAYAHQRTSFVTPPVSAYDTDPDSEDETGSVDNYSEEDVTTEDEDEEDATSDESDDSSDEESEAEDDTPPVTLAGSKRCSEDTCDDERASKKLRSTPPPVRRVKRRPAPITVHLPSPAPSSPPTSPSVSSTTSECAVERHSSPITRKVQDASLKQASLPPTLPTDPLLGPDGVPLGTVRARLPRVRHRTFAASRDAFIQLDVPIAGAKGNGEPIKISGDPTPYVNWNLDAHDIQPYCLTGDPTDYANWDLNAVPPAKSTHSYPASLSALSRVPSVSSLPSLSRSSSMSSLTSTDSSSSTTSDTSSDSATVDDVVVAKTTVKPAAIARQTPAPPTTRRPTRVVSYNAPPVVSYEEAAGVITSPTRATFAQSQLSTKLAKVHTASITTPTVSLPSSKQRCVGMSVGRTSSEGPSPSDLVNNVLSSGFIEASSKASSIDDNQPRRRSPKARGRKSSPTTRDEKDAVQTRLAEIEQEAARLEAERQSLQRLASVGG